MTSPRSGRPAWVLKLALALGSLVFAVLLVEVTLRVVGISYPRRGERHDVRGTAYIPNTAWLQQAEGFAHIRINDDGFRDDDWSRDAAPGTLRIAVLGDSYVDALQVEEPDRFTERLAVELPACPRATGFAIEVMNFGKSGYGTAEELLTYRHNVRPYRPDLVVLAFLPHNDLHNNSKELQRDPGRPYFVHEGHELVLDDSFLETPFHQQSLVKRLGNAARDYSRTAQVLYTGRRRLVRRAEGERRAAVAAELNDVGQAELGLDDMSYLEPADPAWREAWRITEDIMRRMRDDVHADGAGLLIMSLTAGDQVAPDPDERARFAASLGTDDLLYPGRRVQRLGDQEDIPVLDLAPVFQREAEAQGTHLHGFDRPGSGHWNQDGHALAGATLADAICEAWPRLLEARGT